MWRVATPSQRTTWAREFGRRLKGFVPCVGGNPVGVTHWSAAERHWNGGTTYVRLCDLIGSWEPAPRGTVDCMTCLIRADSMFERS